MKRFLLIVALVLSLSATASACDQFGAAFVGGPAFVQSFGVQRFGVTPFGVRRFNSFGTFGVGGGFQQNTVIRRGPFGRQVIRQQTFGF